ncbi:hypothetical protein HU200_000745 [Digitaria exilis]|uniref:Uncharacterized protein n=1 Tax=Digitaria exilis TaxID=1010633 RepID=A0A835FXN6_9POAL|nr:hypothetical protein HU200_000745 [Digitaria exilis]
MEAARGTGASSSGFLSGFTPNEYKTLVVSAKPLRGSVVRIIQVLKDEGVIGTGTAFLVHRDERRGLFLTCEHNFVEDNKGSFVIRFFGGDNEDDEDNEDQDYPIERIFNRDSKRDILLFSAKDIPECQCLQISTDEVKPEDNVVMIGYVSPTLSLNANDEPKELVLVKKPAVIPGKIL